MKKSRIQHSRENRQGTTLVGLLVACAIVSFVTLALLGLLSMNSTQGAYLWSRMDTLNSVNYVLAVMGQRVRSARNLGELYGVAPPPQSRVIQTLPPGPQVAPEAVDPSQIPVSQIEDGSITMIANYFPSEGDPLYGPGGSMAVVSWPWGGGQGNPYQLSTTCLILQVPAFDNNGFPQSLPPAYAGAPPLSAVDTYVYNVIPDPNRLGQYMMQLAYFPAPSGLTNVPSGIQPGTVTTVVTGIVGPTVNGSPGVFQYIDKFQTQPTTTVTAAELQNYSGVFVNLEIANTDTQGRTALLPVRTAMYMRNNVAATTIGSPPTN